MGPIMQEWALFFTDFHIFQRGDCLTQDSLQFRSGAPGSSLICN
eukprot:SAG22_NODE_10935_length_509_cov_0.963415_1_plen_43_part_01